MRAVIYARYSSDLQNERSLADQIALARQRVTTNGWTCAEVYQDAAISGASTYNRPGMQKLLADAKDDQFDIVVTESIDRLSRDLADIAQFYKVMTFHRVQIETLSDGSVSEMHIGIKGLMSGLFLKDLAQKTKRGQIGRLNAGRVPSGLCYGYDVTRDDGSDERGLRAINPDQAKIVRRIYDEYLAGRGPKAIIVDLNKDGVPSPRGGMWSCVTLNGGKSGLGVLRNEVYCGWIVFNKVSGFKDPVTGRKTWRANPESAWMKVEAPHLRILSDEAFAAAQERRQVVSQRHAVYKRRPKRPLSGLIVCGTCGANYVTTSKNVLGCRVQLHNGGCTQKRTVKWTAIEGRVIEGLKRFLSEPELARLSLDTYRRERERLAAESRRSRSTNERQLADVEGRISRLVTAIESGAEMHPLTQRLKDLTAERDQLRQQVTPPVEAVVHLHPHAVGWYLLNIEKLAAALAAGVMPSHDVVQTLRTLVTRIVVRDVGPGQPVKLEIHGLMEEFVPLATVSTVSRPST